MAPRKVKGVTALRSLDLMSLEDRMRLFGCVAKSEVHNTDFTDHHIVDLAVASSSAAVPPTSLPPAPAGVTCQPDGAALHMGAHVNPKYVPCGSAYEMSKGSSCGSTRPSSSED